MRDEAFNRFAEDVVRHGMAEQTAKIQHWDVDFLSEIDVGD